MSDAQGPIYIGGLDRCGKTMMQAFLTSHPLIAIPAVGSNMWTYFYGQYGDLGRHDNFERCLEAMLHYSHVAFLQPDPARIRTEFRAGPATYARLFALFLIHFAEKQGKPRWGAQTGMIERYADQLFAAYPGLKLIHMLRDPRDRYAASLARAPKGKGRAGGATARWLYTVHLAQHNARRYPGHYKIVSYETMVAEPEATLRDVCAFLDEEYLPEILAMPGAPDYRTKISRMATDRFGPSPVSTAFIGQYRDTIPVGEIAFMQFLGGREMIAHGYTPVPIRLTAQELLQFALRDGPLNLLRMAAWLGVESLQQRFPAHFGRKPATKTIITQVKSGQSSLQTTQQMSNEAG